MQFLTTIFGIKKYRAIHQIESLYNKLFSVEKESWNIIYRNKIKIIYESRESEFDYKLLNNTPCSNSFEILFKCRYRSSDKCNMCNDIEDMKHLLHVFDINGFLGVTIFPVTLSCSQYLY